MEDKLYAEEIVNNFYKKEIIKRSPNSPLLQTPHITFKIQCKNLDTIKDYYYFNKTSRKQSVSRLVNLAKDAEQFLKTENSKPFMKIPGIFYETILITESNIDEIIPIKSTLKKDNKPRFNINPFQSNIILHSSPRWLHENSFNTINGRYDKVMLKFYKTKNNKNNKKRVNILKMNDPLSEFDYPDKNEDRNPDQEIYYEIEKDDETEYFGFQIIPLIQLEKLKELQGRACFRIIEDTPENYFCQWVLEDIEASKKRVDSNYNSEITNEKNKKSISQYIDDEENVDYFYEQVMKKINLHNIQNFRESEDYKSIPLVIINYNYKTFGKLWKMSAVVHSIIQREIDINGKPIKQKRLDFENDELTQTKKSGKSAYMYKIFCKRNDGLNWFKEMSFEEIVVFRQKIIHQIPEMKNYPFPYESVLAKFPIIGKYYSDENDDVLIEKKFTLDNFFDNLLEKEEVYRLDIFNDFFSTD